MLDSVRGRVLVHDAGGLVLECGAVALRLRTPPRALAGLAPGSDARVATQLLMRDELPVLYGFADAAQRDLFNVLRGVAGLGPERALALLGNLDPATLAAAVRTRDAARLRTVKGIGAKLAERLVVELQDEVDRISAGAAGAGTVADRLADLSAALAQLGYPRGMADDAARRALKETGDDVEVAEALRVALRLLQRAALD